MIKHSIWSNVVNVEQVHIFCAYLLVAYLALIAVTPEGLSFLSLPIFTTIVFIVFAYSAFIVWAASLEKSLGLKISHAFTGAEITPAQFNLIYIGCVRFSTLKTNAGNVHSIRAAFIRFKLSCSKFRATLSGTETTWATRPRLKNFSAMFTYAFFHVSLLALRATTLGAKLIFSTPLSDKFLTTSLANKRVFHGSPLVQLYPVHSKYIMNYTIGQS